ncbi:hypothetical protein AABC73_13630 [Pseudomonas sp. G.S.17]|uniref:hypothetical protein n=1 Tax=Pseudomonas sp. G.S.17 TaxID=3137451 RepID=UPI00311C931E
MAPAFYQTAELNEHYLSKQIANNSFGFRPGDVGLLPDEDPHCVVFNNRLKAYRCSDDPSPVNALMLVGAVLGAPQRQRATRDLDKNGIRELGYTFVDVLRQSRSRRSLVGHKSVDPDAVARAIDGQPTLRTLAFISRTVFDAELLVVR